jgi:membrane protein involved in colicin uptake
MSDTSAFGFGKFVPGFDFLQNLSKTAAQAAPAAGTGAVPGMASWVAPTLSVEEIDKRIQELKSVLFWLEQNTTALKATIQAMEVQKMTLSTLQSMNVNMADLAKAFTAKAPEAEAPAAPEPAPAQAEAAPEPEVAQEKSAPKSSDKTSAKPAVDPMQWWGALTQQFQDIAAAAVKDVAAEAMKAGMTAKGASTTAASKKSPAAKKAPAKKAASAKTQAAAKSAPRKAASKRTNS